MPNQPAKVPYTPHDQFAGKLLNQQTFAEAFFRVFVPDSITRYLQWDTLKLEKNEHIDDLLSPGQTLYGLLPIQTLTEV